MSKLKKDAEKYPIYHVAVILLIALGVMCLPIERLFFLFIKDGKTALYFGNAACDLTVTIAAIILIFKYGLSNSFSKISIKGALMVLPTILVLVNNFPLISLFTGGVTITASNEKIVFYTLHCLFTAFSEQLIFTGILYPLLTWAYKKSNYKKIYALLTTAALFSLSHLVNLFGGASIAQTLMQVGYTFLTGAMFLAAYVICENIFIPVLMHFVYDFGGLMLDRTFGIGIGEYFTTLGIILTAVIGVCVGVYLTVVTLRKVKEEKIQEGTKNE